MEIDDLTLHWLAGLLEGEGSFHVINKNGQPVQPAISIKMTDEDVIAKVAAIFDVKYFFSNPKRYQENGWKGTYSTKVSGQKAVDLMNSIKPIMGQRRQQKIDEVVVVHRPRYRGLTPEKMEELRQRALNGESPFHLAKEYGISKTLAYYIKDGYTYQQLVLCECSSAVEHLPSKQRVARPNRVTRSHFSHPVNPPTNNSQVQTTENDITNSDLYWLAGLLEAEGSFMAPAPSRPNSPIISISMTDEDVIERVAALFGTKHQRWQPKNLAHKMNFMAKRRGAKAVALMRALYPLMAERRKAQIDRAIAGYHPR